MCDDHGGARWVFGREPRILGPSVEKGDAGRAREKERREHALVKLLR